MTRTRGILALCAALAAGAAGAQETGTQDARRGELLYETHCVTCHKTQMHWRRNKLAVDWGTLQQQVQRWQGVARLGWKREEIEAVARYLNSLYYHYDVPQREGRAAAADPHA